MNKEINKINGVVYKQIFSFVFAFIFFYLAYWITQFPEESRWAIVYSLYGFLCFLTGFRLLRNHPWLYFIFSMAALAGGILHWPEIHHELENIFPGEPHVADIGISLRLFFCSVISFILGIFTLRKWS